MSYLQSTKQKTAILQILNFITMISIQTNMLKYFLLFLLIVFCSSCKTDENHDYVDLGLPSGTLWATCNVGITTPSGYADLYAWGETDCKIVFQWDFYRWGNDKNLIKYCLDSTKGHVDNLEVLQEEDDVATVLWGDDWRMPSETEINELIKGCQWKWTENYEGTQIKGMIGTSLFNKKTIFFPACKYVDTYIDHNLVYYGYCHSHFDNMKGFNVVLEGCYFSRNLAFSSYATSLNFESDRLPYVSSESRMKGCMIRAVRSEKIDCKQKNCPAVLKESFALSADSVAKFNVVGDYISQSLIVSGYFNCHTDWEYNYVDTLVTDSIMFMMVRGKDTKKNKTKSPHKSAYFRKRLKISKGIKKVVFGPTLETIWTRTTPFEYKLEGNPVCEMISIVSSTDLCPYYSPTVYEKKDDDWVEPKRCRDTSEFANIVLDKHVLNGYTPCDVNKDGFLDYILLIEGPYEQGEYPNDKDDEDDEHNESKHANEGIMLVVNEGDTSFVSSLSNSGCFYPIDQDGGCYFAPELMVWANADSLEIHYGHGRYGWWNYKFLYRDGNYQLTETNRCSNRGPILEWGSHIDLEKGYEEIKILKTDFPYKDSYCLDEEPDDDSYKITKFKIKRYGNYTLTNIRQFCY